MKPRPTTLRIAQWGQMTTLCLPVYLAQEAGYLKEAGIHLRYILTGNADQTVAAVANGDCDLAMSGPTMCALSEWAQYDMKVIAAIVDRAAVHGLTTSPVIDKMTDISDFVGLRVAAAPRPSTAYSLLASLKKKNRRILKNMAIIEAPIGQQIEFVRRGEADLYIDQEPYVSLAASKNYRVVFDAATLFKPLSFTSLYARADMLEIKKESISALCAAVMKACALIYKEPKKTDMLAARIFKGLPQAVIHASVARLRAAQVWPKNLITTKEAWDNALAIRHSIGTRFVRNAWKIVDNSFVKTGTTKH